MSGPGRFRTPPSAATALLVGGLVAAGPAPPAPASAPPVPVARPGPGWQRALRPEQLRGGVLRWTLAPAGAPAPEQPLSVAELLLPDRAIERPLEPVRLPLPGGCEELHALDWSRRDRLGGRVRVDGPADDGFVAGGVDGRAYEVRPLRSGRSPVRVAFDWAVRQQLPPRTRVLDLREVGVLRVDARGGLAAMHLRLVDAHGSYADVGFTRTPAGLEGWSTLELAPAEARGIDRGAVARLEIELPPASAPLRLDRLRLCPSGAAAATGTRAAVHRSGRDPAGAESVRDGEPAGAAPQRPGERGSVRALWVWSTRSLLADAQARTALTRLLQERGFNRVYLQLPGAFARGGPDERLRGALAALLSAIEGAGVEVWALDGAPEMARAGGHDAVLRRVAAIVAFNAAAPGGVRFAGLQLDVEPYLLPEFEGDGRDRLIDEYLALLAAVHDHTRAAGLCFEAAVPFWFDGIGRTRPGGRGFRPLVEEVLDRTDGIALMDYRTRAEGEDGTLAAAEQELLYASRTGKRVLLALETTDLPDALHVHFRGPGVPLAAAPARADDGWVLAAGAADGLRLWWLRQPGREALLAFARGVGIDPAEARVWPVSHTVRAPASRTTFAPLGAAALDRVLQRTAAGAARYPAFAGMAVHHFGALQRLLARSPAPASKR